MTSDELSGFAIIISFAIGLMAVVVLFIFAKRQITRFSLKSRRGPHQPIGLNAHKSLRKEIERRLDAVREIKYEPKILDHPDKRCQNNQNYPHYWRMRAVDQLELLQECIDRACPKDPEYHRPPRQDLRIYLLKMAKDGGPLRGCETRLIHQFVDAYVHARHEPTPDFNEQEYNNYMNLLNKLRNYVRKVKSLKSSNIDPDDETKLDKDEDKSKDTSHPELNGQTRLRLMNLTLPEVRDEPKSETCV